MTRYSDHRYDAPADAPFEQIEIQFRYWPGTPDEGPSYSSGGTPGEPASVEWTTISVKCGGVWHHDLPAWLSEQIAKQHDDDLFDQARSDREMVSAYRARRIAA
jgi:hypothetical protein